MIKFTAIVIRNFLSWKDRTDFNLSDQGLIYLTGPNGSGKSSIFDGITWALFGRTTKQLLADDVVNNVSCKDTMVSLYLSKNNKEYIISRFRSDTDYGNKITLHISGKKVEQQVGLQDLIENIIGCNYERFIQTVFFSQGDKRYFTSLQPARQRVVLGEMFNFSVFKEAQKRAREEFKVLAAEASSLSIEYEHKKSLYKDGKSRCKSLEEDLKEAKKVGKEHRKFLVEKKGKLSQDIDHQKELLEEISLKRWAAEELIKEYKSFEIDLRKIKGDISLAKKGRCSLCGSILSDKKGKELLSQLKRQKKEVEKEITERQDNFEKYDKKYFDHLEESEFPCAKELKKLNAEYIDVRAEIKSLGSDAEHIQALREKEVRLTIKRQKSYLKHKVMLKKVQRELRYYDFWDTSFGSKGIEIYALSKILPYFNNIINKYLEYLPTEKGILKADFCIDKDQLVSNLEYEGTSKYAGASGGEKRRLDLCVNLALVMLAKFKLNALLLDEPFEGLDDLGISGAVRLLSELGIESVFVSSHLSELRTYFPKVWSIGIEDGMSKVLDEVSGGVNIL